MCERAQHICLHCSMLHNRFSLWTRTQFQFMLSPSSLIENQGIILFKHLEAWLIVLNQYSQWISKDHRHLLFYALNGCYVYISIEKSFSNFPTKIKWFFYMNLFFHLELYFILHKNFTIHIQVFTIFKLKSRLFFCVFQIKKKISEWKCFK